MNRPPMSESSIEVTGPVAEACQGCDKPDSYRVRLGTAKQGWVTKLCPDCAAEVYEDVMAADADYLRSHRS